MTSLPRRSLRELLARFARRHDERGVLAPSGLGANAEVLLWQNQVRLHFAAALGILAVALRLFEVVAGSAVTASLVLVGYGLFVLASSALIRWLRRAGEVHVIALTLADLVAVFALVAAVTPPAYYPRALLLVLLALEYTRSLLGGAAGIVGITGGAVGYLAAVALARHRGVELSWGEELWTLALFLIVAISSERSRRYFNRRLATLVELFAQAQRGDFALAYDERLDFHPDGLTRVGRAYNHLRHELASLVLTDPLTGCVNRRGFEQELTRTVARASRYGGELALLAVDVDHFKKVNDTYGHLAGDVVLREVAELIRRAARAGDMVARLGGEEFVVVLPHTDGEDAGVVAERIMELVRAHEFRAPRERVKLTVSIGIAAEQVVDPAASAALRARADEALYVAKRLGRDRVVLWAPGSRSRATPPFIPALLLREEQLHREPQRDR